MANQEGGSFRNWKERFYWGNFFQFSTFVQILYGSFHQQLAIPDKFLENLDDKLEGVVKLRGRSGAWNVEVGFSVEGEALFLGSGWKKLVKDNSLEKGDVLTFNYRGNSQFDVVVHDHKSKCEKEAFPIVRKSNDVASDQIMTPNFCSRIYPAIYKYVEALNRKRRHIENGDCLLTPSREQEEEQRPIVPTKKRSKRVAMENSRLPFALDDTQGETSRRSSPSHVEENISSARTRRYVTEEERDMAKQKAEYACKLASESNIKSFVAKMLRSYVYPRFYMRIPCDWLNENIPRDIEKISLRMGECTWDTPVQRRGNSGGLSTGWNRFAKDNCLEEDDVCLFKLGENRNGGITLDVEIFYAV